MHKTNASKALDAAIGAGTEDRRRELFADAAIAFAAAGNLSIKPQSKMRMCAVADACIKRCNWSSDILEIGGGMAQGMERAMMASLNSGRDMESTFEKNRQE